MNNFDLSKITGREPPIETDEDILQGLVAENEALGAERDALRAELTALKKPNSANTVALPKIDGEVQRYQFGPDGDEWVKADDYAELADYGALIQMERDSARTEVERLRAALEQAQAELCADEFDRQGLADYLRGVLWPVPSPGDVR